MKSLIRKIRHFVGLSQQEFADKLGVTFASINRWENGKTLPNNLAQMNLYEYCKENSIPVYELMMNRIKEEVESLNINSERMILYHGSKSGIEGTVSPISRSRCDFGSGFYMGTDPMQPLTLICDFDQSKFYVVSILLKNLNVHEVPADIEWAMTVAYNRGKMDSIKDSEIYNKYSSMCKNKDLIIGNIADDRMFYVLDNFFSGNITDMALVKSLSVLQLGKQYVAVSQKGCDAVRIEKEISISYLERKFLQDISEENRTKGVNMANEICKNYRREGLFFDEILDKAIKG